MLISSAMNAKLNEQIAIEFSAAQKYLAMACWLERHGLKFLAKRFRKQHEEERGHGLKIASYVLDVGGTVVLDALPKPQNEFNAVRDVVQASVDGELYVTKCINDLVSLAEEENDYATRSFLQWFVNEQVEEVETMSHLLAMVELAGNNVLQVEALVRHEMVGEGK